LIRWLTNLILGLPIAYYLCCVVIGNVDARQTGLIRKDRLLSAFSGFHLIPRAALIASLVLFITVYLVYIAMMGGYLFSALFGELPDGFTYAEYARRGFFELLAVAVINAVIIGTLWLLAKREALEHPALLRALTAILAFLTLLLVTAAAKMHLYVQNYNLTLLRFYCCCFLLVLAVSYILLLVWCLRPFNLGRPVIALFVCIFLVMVLVNPPALIAGFNTERYLSGATPRIDIEMLEQYGVDALPSLQRLSDEAPERTQRDQADQAILRIQERVYEPGRPWYRRNLDYQLKGVYDRDKR
ncbi:MAG: DUF4173 domain-containing protein, partial [Coriobacteriia bacterium]|nr:DUF4173 domain-containing protein [Coriobacteriia bacterium]